MATTTAAVMATAEPSTRVCSRFWIRVPRSKTTATTTRKMVGLPTAAATRARVRSVEICPSPASIRRPYRIPRTICLSMRLTRRRRSPNRSSLLSPTRTIPRRWQPCPLPPLRYRLPKLWSRRDTHRQQVLLLAYQHGGLVVVSSSNSRNRKPKVRRPSRKRSHRPFPT